MPESNEPQDRPGGKTPYRPASPETPDIPLADVETPPEPKPDPIAPLAPPPEPPDEPIDEGAIVPD
jgi:hypothetical protein